MHEAVKPSFPTMSELTQSQALSSAKAEEFEIFQDDDEFEEFEEGTKTVRRSWASHVLHLSGLYLTISSPDWGQQEEEKDDTLWDADWDDADVTDDFAKQLRFVHPNFSSLSHFCPPVLPLLLSSAVFA